MRRYLSALPAMFILFVGTTFAHAESKFNVANVDKNGFAIQGYDPVSYFQGDKPKKGDTKIQEKLDGATYLFANEANRKEFQKDPKKYEPQFAGWCAYAVADSKSKVDIDPKSFVIQDGKLLLFYNGIWADTRKKWLQDPTNYLKTAATNWPEVEKKLP